MDGYCRVRSFSKLKSVGLKIIFIIKMSICFLKAIIPIHKKGNKTTKPKKLKNEYVIIFSVLLCILIYSSGDIKHNNNNQGNNE